MHKTTCNVQTELYIYCDCKNSQHVGKQVTGQNLWTENLEIWGNVCQFWHFSSFPNSADEMYLTTRVERAAGHFGISLT